MTISTSISSSQEPRDLAAQDLQGVEGRAPPGQGQGHALRRRRHRRGHRLRRPPRGRGHPRLPHPGRRTLHETQGNREAARQKVD